MPQSQPSLKWTRSSILLLFEENGNMDTVQGESKDVHTHILPALSIRTQYTHSALPAPFSFHMSLVNPLVFFPRFLESNVLLQLLFLSSFPVCWAVTFLLFSSFSRPRCATFDDPLNLAHRRLRFFHIPVDSLALGARLP